ncbi:hypothetical protein NP493_891g00029 [Ridgeia piscesae]|uniref:Uncharacterized protein n=1 Tax=Ridgeia piscesae TaxID=27915 RepID=A0AAD9KL82_RIDPI|nr:hypothetical protein NP493_891g00029 [Ridgeia piscesae]
MLLVLVKKTVLFHFNSPPTKFPHDITTQRELTALFNMRVVKATRCERPLQGQKHRFGPVKHSGVVVTLADGRTFLVHKTVVTDTKHMDWSKWMCLESKKVHRSKVTDYVKAGGSVFHTLWDNCHGAASRMMRLP